MACAIVAAQGDHIMTRIPRPLTQAGEAHARRDTRSIQCSCLERRANMVIGRTFILGTKRRAGPERMKSSWDALLC